MLTVLHLEDRLLGQIAPNNPAEFLRLLNEADACLLEAGKWAWTRQRLRGDR